eukprot:m.151878 g.151878  ORF g.151878 m.151878 type:complete len:631 (-) comp23368_c0_seq3:61-1953(-)
MVRGGEHCVPGSGGFCTECGASSCSGHLAEVCEEAEREEGQVDECRSIISSSSSKSLEYGTVDDVAAAMAEPSGWSSKLIILLCGMATFARTECVLLQTVFFAECCDYGAARFYTFAQLLLFVPGPIVIWLVRRYERHDGKMTTFQRAMRKIVLANVTSSVAIIALVLEICYTPMHARRYALAYYWMPIIGAGASLQFQALTDLLSAFPTDYVAILLVGSYTSFAVFAPVNSLGLLCVKNEYAVGTAECGGINATHSGMYESTISPTSEAGSGAIHMMPATCTAWEIQWKHVWVFYAVAILLCVQSICGLWYLSKTALGRKYLAIADEVERKAVAAQSVHTTTVAINRAHVYEDDDEAGALILPASEDFPPVSPTTNFDWSPGAARPRPRRRQTSIQWLQSVGKAAVQRMTSRSHPTSRQNSSDDEETFPLTGVSPVEPGGEAIMDVDISVGSDSEVGLLQNGEVAVKLPMTVLYSTFMSTVANVLVSAQYDEVPSAAMWQLPTYLLYEYYMASSIAALLASRFPCGQQTGVVVSTIRMGLVIFVYWYVRMPGLANSTVLPLSDEAALIFNVLYIMSGVWVFASSFTVITATFRHNMELQQTALAWNNGAYFVGIVLALVVNIAIVLLVW